MSEETTDLLSSIDKIMPDKPHVLAKLQMVITGGHALAQDERGQILDHLVSCAYCQNALEMMMTATLDASAGNPVENPSYKLLTELMDVNHKILEREEYIAAYAETLEMSGIEEAASRFPELAEHLKNCEACKTKVKDMQIALRQAEQVGLIAPLRGNAKVQT